MYIKIHIKPKEKMHRAEYRRVPNMKFPLSWGYVILPSSVCDSLHGVLPTREARSSISVQSFYWGCITLAGYLWGSNIDVWQPEDLSVPPTFGTLLPPGMTSDGWWEPCRQRKMWGLGNTEGTRDGLGGQRVGMGIRWVGMNWVQKWQWSVFPLKTGGGKRRTWCQIDLSFTTY